MVLTKTDRQVIFKIIAQYHVVLDTISASNKLVRFLMLEVDLLIVPFISSLIIITLSPSETSIQAAMKWLLFAAIPPLRGVLLTSVLTRIDVERRTLHIFSRLARGNIKYLYTKLRLLRMMEDLSRSHMVMKEYGGSVTQMDVFEFASE